VDTGKQIKRTEFRAGQVIYPKKKIDRIKG